MHCSNIYYEQTIFGNVSSTTLNKFPDVIKPPGLSLQRRWYLHDMIRDFCPPETKDLVCPKPDLPPPTWSTPQPPSPPSSSPPNSSHPGTSMELSGSKAVCVDAVVKLGTTNVLVQG